MEALDPGTTGKAATERRVQAGPAKEEEGGEKGERGERAEQAQKAARASRRVSADDDPGSR